MTTRPPGRTAPPESPARRLTSPEARRWFILVVVALLTTLTVADYGRVPTEPVAAGDVAPRTIRAPFTFSYQDPAAHAQAREQAADAAPTVFLHDEGLHVELQERLSAAFRRARVAMAPPEPPSDTDAPADASQPDEVPTPDERPTPPPAEVVQQFARDLAVPVEIEELLPLAVAGFPDAAEQLGRTWLRKAYDGRLVVADEAMLPADGAPLRVVPRVNDRDPYVLEDRSRLVTPEVLRQEITLSALRDKGEAAWIDALEHAALALVTADLVYDPTRTQASRDARASEVALAPIVVQRGETLFREGDRVSSREAAAYKALQRSRSEHGFALELGTVAVFLFLLLGTGFYVLRASREPGARDDTETRDLMAVGALVVLTALLARLTVMGSVGLTEALGNDAQPPSVWYLVPVAAGAMLVRLLMDLRWTVYFTVVASAVAGVIMQLDAVYIIYFVLTSAVAASTVEQLRERISVLKAGVVAGGFGALLVLFVHFLQLYVGEGELSLAVTVRPLWSMSFALGGGLLSGFLVLALVPLFETMGFVTDYRMLELASLNHPLMRQLMLRAPGTYHHSVVVGTLAEAACDAIGANALEAKISAYFHDIGKARKPQFFVENQRGGPNRHNDLDPATSAQIIISHVTEGARMAREHKLPKPILDNILMHHGTGLLQYFFAKAQMEADDPDEVDPSVFRYPGPKPNTRESGVVMLADKVEAATRSIQHPTEDAIRAMINRIINSVMADDQFSECPLTFREIYTIADTFVTVLLGIYHQRIEYPQTRSISSRAADADAPAEDDTRGQLPDVGTITLDLEGRPEGAAERDEAFAHLWSDDYDEADPDPDTDYEAVRNLPQGDP